MSDIHSSHCSQYSWPIAMKSKAFWCLHFQLIWINHIFIWQGFLWSLCRCQTLEPGPHQSEEQFSLTFTGKKKYEGWSVFASILQTKRVLKTCILQVVCGLKHFWFSDCTITENDDSGLNLCQKCARTLCTVRTELWPGIEVWN